MIPTLKFWPFFFSDSFELDFDSTLLSDISVLYVSFFGKRRDFGGWGRRVSVSLQSLSHRLTGGRQDGDADMKRKEGVTLI